ncbi:glutathione S-transferase family protein [Rhodophyticola sp.]|uniref:glutathione S-transferase family protein n=1 Tax=Rhodophyticola sp. TaxID=2680032 RepID=UPI001B0E9172|nr:glutathione S-transferase family protein [Roseicyclus sp.]MBO6625186.1 glutathione S-transferase family protein [Roseicyclus sp.]MBO6923998.1 glutathione S-transferase family protein [Roseicyclus sp.]
MTGLTLIGFQDSVYTRAVRLALSEKALAYAYDEVNPFTEDGQARLAGDHPFGRVPVLRHEAFDLYETQAILGYLDDAFDAPQLFPEDARARARVRQVMGITDSYLYQPLVRQVFSHGVYRAHMGLAAEAAVLRQGLAASGQVLDALEGIAAAGLVLTGRDVSRADCLLAPMIDYFALVPEGRAMLEARPALNRWFAGISARAAFAETRPGFVAVLEGGR